MPSPTKADLEQRFLGRGSPPRRKAPYALGGTFDHEGPLHFVKSRADDRITDDEATRELGQVEYDRQMVLARGAPRILDDDRGVMSEVTMRTQTSALVVGCDAGGGPAATRDSRQTQISNEFRARGLRSYPPSAPPTGKVPIGYGANAPKPFSKLDQQYSKSMHEILHHKSPRHAAMSPRA